MAIGENEKTALFKAVATLKQDFTVECESRGHKVIFDESKLIGGGDMGMNPIEATLAALGACQCIIARLFAKDRGVDLQGLRMELEGDMFVPDLKNIADGKSTMRIKEIRSRVYIKSSAKGDIVKEFVSFIENNCPVADLLKNPTQMIPEVILEQ
jgi:uncharacterized OsmC-like protein